MKSLPDLAYILFGAAFLLVSACSLGSFLVRPAVPFAVTLAVGCAVLSTAIFLLLLSGAANRVWFTILGLIALGIGALGPGRNKVLLPKAPPLYFLIFFCYGLLYLVHALAPEIQPDGITYHLGLVKEYARLGAFPNRIGFFEILPHGVELLYLFGTVFGGFSSAKLVHFALLAASATLIGPIGRRAGLSSAQTIAAAAFYFCAPVVGVSGTASYTDAALVLFTLTAFYLLLAWKQDGDDRLLPLAGLAAGFCYSVKFTGLLVFGLALLYSLRKPARAALLAIPGALMIAPWVIRAWWLTANPFAPLMNRWFHNPYFHIATERDLAESLRGYHVSTLWSVPFDLTIGSALQGVIGPLFLLLPLALMALRVRQGRILWLAATVLALPWLFNWGTRFLMPSLPFFALALAVALPSRALWAAALFHAISCWPAIQTFWESPDNWRLRGFPLAAALRIQPEQEYLRRNLWEFRLAKFIEANTRPGDPIFALITPAWAYLDREIIDNWHSPAGERLLDTLRLAWRTDRMRLLDVTATWPERPLMGLRFLAAEGSTREMCIHEVIPLTGDPSSAANPRWGVRSLPDPAGAPYAIDGNFATHWRTWEPARAGMYLEVDFQLPVSLRGVTLTTHGPYGDPRVEVDGRDVSGRWHALATSQPPALRPAENLRWAAIAALRAAGIRYILAPTGSDGFDLIGSTMANEPWRCGLREVASYESVHLFQIPQP